MKKLGFLIMVGILSIIIGGVAIADWKTSTTKLKNNLETGAANNGPPAPILTKEEFAELIDTMQKFYKKQGHNVSREEAAAGMGLWLGYATGQNSQVKQAPTQKKPAPQSQASTIPVFDIGAYCKRVAKVSGGSYAIESGCIDMENEAKKELLKMQIPAQVMSYCSRVTKSSQSAYSILQGCVEMELEAKQKIGK